MTRNEPQPSGYDDYRDYFKDRFAWAREQNSRLSLNFFARKMKVSTAFLSMLFSKKKHMSLNSLVAVSDYLKLDRLDRIILVFNLLQATSKALEHREFFRQMGAQLKGYRLIDRDLPSHDVADVRDIYSTELRMVLSAFSQVSGFKPDVDWVMERLRFVPESRAEVEKVLTEVIAAHKRMATDPNVSDVETTFPGGNFGISVYRPGLGLHAKAIAAADSFSPSAFVSLGMTLNEEAYREMLREFGQFCKRLEVIAEKAEVTDRVYVFNAGMFCVASPPAAK
jgi:hypothetical protein